ncbi:hypothetical protein KC865_05050 [Candidatus Kaiserbacteria bacterium]|nr:hypothetical protein [Candidatus Kaiserbacteria bacterium]
MFEYPCSGIVLDVLAENQAYLTEIPYDPQTGGEDITGYRAVITNDNRVSVCAPDTYADEPIVVTQ